MNLPTLPTLALVGRPNVGKSTLFNRLIGHRQAIVENFPGVTRDRQYGNSEWIGYRFRVIDTGGLEPESNDQMLMAMRSQTIMALQEADVILMIFDGRDGLLPQDREILRSLRLIEKPIIYAVNKIDNISQEALAADFYALGIDDIHVISAVHGAGVGDLLDVVVGDFRQYVQEESDPYAHEKENELEWYEEVFNEFENFNENSNKYDDGGDYDEDDDYDEDYDYDEDDDHDDDDDQRSFVERAEEALKSLPPQPKMSYRGADRVPQIAVIGKPNAGKSTLINHLFGSERVLATPIAGTTRDSIDVPIVYNDQEYLIIDTAGIRRQKYVQEKLEKLTISKALKSIDRCDIAVFMIDATEGITSQDAKVVGFAHNKGKGVVLMINKWDQMPKGDKALKTFEENLRYQIKYIHYAPIVFGSALTGKNIHKLFETIHKIHKSYYTRVSTGELNRFFEEMMRYHPPPLHRGRPIKFYYIAQVAMAPPTFLISANQPKAAHVTYQRFIINSLRKEFEFFGVPIRIIFRKRS